MLEVKHWHGEYDHHIVAAVAREHAIVIPFMEGATILDIGAHIGCFTVLALNHGAKHVIAIEPGGPSVKLLKKNVAIELDRVTILHAGVTGVLTDHITLRYLSHKNSMPGAKTVDPTKPRMKSWQGVDFTYEKVHAVWFEGTIKNHQPKVIKLDCEGMEYDCIENIKVMPRCVKVISVEWHKTSTKAINRYVTCTKKLYDWGFRPSKVPNVKLIYKDKKLVGSNQLFIRPVAWIRK